MLDHPEGNQKINLDISIATALKVTSVVLLMILSLQFVGSILTIILLFFTALFLAVALNPAVSRISEALSIKKRGLATGIAFGLVVLIIGSFLVITIKPIANHISEFAGAGSGEGAGDSQDQDSFKKRVEAFKKQDNFVAEFVVRYEIDDRLTDLAGNVAERFADDDGDGVVNIVQRASSAIGAFVIILIMSFMILIEGPAFINQVKGLLPKDRLRKWQRLGREMSSVITGYINGQIIIAIIAGLFAMLFMTIFRVPNALAMASIVAFCALIPLIGALVGAIIVVALTLLVGINKALIVAIYFIVYQWVENATIQPWIQGQQTNLSTLQVFLAALIGAQIAGVYGVLLSVPVAACLKILIIDYLKTNKDYIEKKYLSVPASKNKKS